MRIIIVLLMLHSSLTDAAVYKCLNDNGKITYSNIRCDTKSAQLDSSKAQGTKTKLRESLLLPEKLNLSSTFTSVSDKFSRNFYEIVFLTYLLMSGICYRVYQKDKKFAKTQQWRIPETTLHLYEILGGWPGALIAQRTLRHKNKKLLFQLTFWLIVALHVIGWFDYLVLNQLLTHQIILFISSLA
jgi:uncharacterized membrane protein YsdA (DUF1294 family)